MLAPVCGFDGGDDLAVDASVRVGLERRFLVSVVAADRFEQTDHPLLYDIFIIRPGDIISFRLVFHQALVFFDQNFFRGLTALLGHFYQLFVR